MRKGKLGISYTTYAVVAFVLAIFGQMLIAAILLGFVLYAERDEWTGRQCMQAFFLTFASGVIGAITALIVFFAAIGSGVSFGYGYYGSAGALVALVIPVILWILVLVFEIRGLVRVAGGQEADVPLLSDWAWRAYGYIRNRQAAPPPPQGSSGQPAGWPGQHPGGQGQPGYPPPGSQGTPPQSGTPYGGTYPPPPPPAYGAPPPAGSPYGSAPPPPPPGDESRPAGEPPL